MKIKYLKIRNIASVERGDIDFENGLPDLTTGSPSSLFLICGDTGSGKSVILDCICMALYGTTPRLKGVSNVQRNTFFVSNSSEISVNAIEQYTRMGISHRDECFAELTFEGNDGKEYVARYALGYTNRGTYREPVWTLKSGGEMVCEKRSQVGSIVRDIIGLTYNQFNRMAMLAQGQFANFLVGKKEEREEILEQLTATDKFSRYGEAISNIYKRTKSERDKVATEKAVYDSRIKSKEQLDVLNAELEANGVEIEKEQAEAKLIDSKLSATESYIKNNVEVRKAEEELNVITALETSEDFVKACSNVKRWDETFDQRGALLSRRKSLLDRQKAEDRLKECRAKMDCLSGDLSLRHDKLNERLELLKKEQQWIAECRSRAMIFENAKALISDMENYSHNLKDRADKVSALDRAKRLSGSLDDALQKASAALTGAKRDVDEISSQIDAKTLERRTLQPEKLNEEHEAAKSRLTLLMDLQTKIAADRTARDETEQVLTELNDFKAREAVFGLAVEKARTAVDNLSSQLDVAKERYTTMHLSVEENFNELRARLVADHAEVCPLCRQGISDYHRLLDDKNFQSILSPLKQEMESLADMLVKAQEVLRGAETDHKTCQGVIKAKEKEVGRLSSRDSEAKKVIDRLVEKLGVVPEEMDSEIETTGKHVIALKDKIAEAEVMQKEINTLIRNRKPLDEALAKAQAMHTKASEDVSANRVAITVTQQAVAELESRIESIRNKINDCIQSYQPEWEEDLKCVSDRLKMESEDYLARVAQAGRLESELKLEEAALTNVEHIRGSIPPLPPAGRIEFTDYSGWTPETITRAWRDLESEVTTAQANLTKSVEEIDEADRILGQFYASSDDATEELLGNLIDSQKKIAQSRENIRELELKKVAAKTSLETAINNRREALERLNIESEEHLPDIEVLKADKTAIAERISALTLRRGAIEAEIKADRENRERAAEVTKCFEEADSKYECWNLLNSHFGGTRFRTLVQTHILRPLLDNANVYLSQITDHFTLTCSEKNEQLSILVEDRYNRNECRSVTVLSGGERFMISLALSLALSAMNRPDLNVNILFIDEGFGTLDAQSLEQVILTLRRLPHISGQNGRRVGVISHREELAERIPTQIRLRRNGQGRSRIEI